MLSDFFCTISTRYNQHYEVLITFKTKLYSLLLYSILRGKFIESCKFYLVGHFQVKTQRLYGLLLYKPHLVIISLLFLLFFYSYNNNIYMEKILHKIISLNNKVFIKLKVVATPTCSLLLMHKTNCNSTKTFPLCGSFLVY